VKPDPAVYQLCLDRLGVAPEEAVAVEDSPRGIAAARSANVYCIAVPNPVTGSMDLGGAQWKLSSLADYAPEAFLDEVAARHADSF
ncbi:MAG TPA: HAD-IA family hydrolase, partial [Candidatus Hydrogenedentes bacterium]|nr:HAD-IA family hydrolase [Candidatus Hydrogenedentota bacterium]